MKKIFLVCLLFLFQSLDAKQIEIEVQEVELNSKLIGIISSFIEYSQVCEDAKNVDYILSLYMRCPPKAIKDSADTKLAIEFYPDELDFHLYEVPKYISRIKILDSVCNVYIRMSLEVEQLWSNYQDYGIFTLSDNYVNIVHRTEDGPICEYDPSFVRMWCITSPRTNKNGFYVEWGASRCCW